MRSVRCEECGKRYDFDVDDFCPRCGAFNQPPRTIQVNSDGTVGQREASSGRSHRESFLHEEYHEENRQRRGTPLAQGAKRDAARRVPISLRQEPRQSVKNPLRVVGWIVGAIVLINLLGSLLTLLRW